MTTGPELVCPAGTPASLRAAVDAGADAVYVGFRDETNARNFPGLNFSRDELAEAVDYAHAGGSHVYLAVNSFARAGDLKIWTDAIDDGARIGVDAVILSDIGMLAYAAETHPDLRLHLSVQASAAHPEALEYYRRAFGIKRAVLPRVLTVDDIRRHGDRTSVEYEVFVFGGLCPMAEGRCHLSSYATGKSPNTTGVCSPAASVHYEDGPDGLVTRLGDFAINRVAPGEAAGYPTLCKGRFQVAGQELHIFEDPVSLNAAEVMKGLVDAGVSALKIEGRQRGRSYVDRAVRTMRSLRDAALRGETPDASVLDSLSEGGRRSTGAYKKEWR
ncbi:protease [Rhodothalassium salexigens]|uniref:Ubiquinone biosynthesis protein UbiU n=1 Tax=Rhodothalassium salexigens DSM 2132 TaxID=1188247 RepID=A0A4R2PPN8_RHOSA|nr:peptidase U32 family protein [Rhodothalassium salexigens]MBB4210695.1 putative protease [Rhodothalassium salexigens DSM 2132]MBK1637896.1 protease [Rhodothalassium salexigens DSM 2132]MBK5910544.1 protease [Rhodothalassium salexigens]MBK5919873.1 protease [Rhodothalassium salexigens]TCP37749.1 putative protease [Rhodothalassium salexigens DSM 2132]